MKKDPLVFTPTVVAPSQAEMEEMEKKRASEDASTKSTTDGSGSAKPKKVQPVGFNPLHGMKASSGPTLKYDKCNDCSCADFSPDTFKKGKCSNCFHIHPVSKLDAPPSPALTPSSPPVIPDDDEEQPPPPTTPFPGTLPKSPETKALDSRTSYSGTMPKTPEARLDSSRASSSEPPRSSVAGGDVSLKAIPIDDALKPPAGDGSVPTSPNAKKLIGAKGFNLGLAPAEAPTEPIVKCKECGCDDFSPDSFKKTKCSNCFHVHAGAPPPPKSGGPKPDEVTVEAVAKCKDCGCGNFKSDAFKKTKCANCFHVHV